MRQDQFDRNITATKIGLPETAAIILNAVRRFANRFWVAMPWYTLQLYGIWVTSWDTTISKVDNFSWSPWPYNGWRKFCTAIFSILTNLHRHFNEAYSQVRSTLSKQILYKWNTQVQAPVKCLTQRQHTCVQVSRWL